MKTKVIIIFLIFQFVIVHLSYNQTYNWVGVKETKLAIFNPIDNQNSGWAEVVRDIFVTEALKYEENRNNVVLKYKVTDRTIVNKVLEEHEFASTGLVDNNQISEIGRFMGADVVCVIEIKSLPNNYFFISAKIINVKTAEVLKSHYDRSKNIFELSKTVSQTLFKAQKPDKPNKPTVAEIKDEIKYLEGGQTRFLLAYSVQNINEYPIRVTITLRIGYERNCNPDNWVETGIKQESLVLKGNEMSQINFDFVLTQRCADIGTGYRLTYEWAD